MSEEKKLNGTVIVTYRCNARCSMCNRYKAPSKPEEEISIEAIKKLPKMYFTNITGGEPFIRTDLKDIVRELYKNGITPFSHRPITLKHTPNRLPQYPHIQSQTPLTDILCIQLHHFFEVRYIASAADLPHSCEAGAEGHSRSVVRFV